MIIELLKNLVKVRRRPKPSRIDSPRTEAYIPLPCGGVGNHIDPKWWEERLDERQYEDDDESFGAQMSRLTKLIRLEREGKKGEPEAIQLRERMDKSRAHTPHETDKSIIVPTTMPSRWGVSLKQEKPPQTRGLLSSLNNHQHSMVSVKNALA